MGRFYLTTPIYYVNDAPHVGHAYTTVAGDAITRWHRLAGDDVFYLTGTDEHGLKVAQSAEANGVSPAEWAALNAERFRAAWAGLDVANDDFIRTSEPRHHAAVGAFLSRIRDNGYIELGTYEGLYCVSCEAYYAESELVGGNCPVHGRPVTRMKEDNYFFKLSAFQERLEAWYRDNPSAVAPETRRNEALGFIRSGLQDISITRTSITWGVPVPWDPGHVFYVWYDALINYLTAIGYGTDPARFEAWWPAAHHLIGKEIVRFHCVWWPAMCMAAGIDPPRQVFVHGWLLVGGEKMSKTGLNQIFPGDLVSDFGVDAVRYHLLRDTALGPDGNFSYEGMVARYNADLANNFGNLVSRVATVVGSKCGGVGPAPRPASGLASGAGARLAGVASEVVQNSSDAWRRFAPQDALEATWRLIRETNAELEATEPWKAPPGPEVDAVLGDALEALRIVAVLASPAMPRACAEVWRRLGLAGSPLDQRLPAAGVWGGYPGGLAVERGAPLFPRRKG
ncbi:MAG: methionine--tRNA ligase [Acidimicrobiales bacterium]